jgi:hypothetical protein
MGLVAGVVMAETGLRLAGMRPQRYPPPLFLAWGDGKFHDAGMWGDGRIKQPSAFAQQGVQMGEYVPGARFKIVYATNPRGYFEDDNSVEVRINSLGMRGPEVEKAKPEGVYRILGLGDSFTFGVGVRDEDTFLRRLETLLNAQPDEGRRCEVLNAGVQGYNTRDEVVCLEQRWLELSPDLVLITFYLNDAYADAAFLNMGQGQGVYLDQPDGLARYSFLYDSLQHAYRARISWQKMYEHYSLFYFTQPQQFFQQAQPGEVDWHVSAQALARAKQLSQERNFKLGLVLFPELIDLDSRYPFAAIHAVIHDACGQLQIPMLDLLEVYRGRDARDLWVHPTDHHPNEEAHRLAAGAIETFLRERMKLEER